MKYGVRKPNLKVAPLAGAWIEILYAFSIVLSRIVAPLAGAWIEMPPVLLNRFLIQSLPSRERGLKCLPVKHAAYRDPSLPSRERGLKFYTGSDSPGPTGRSPRGSVD